MKVFWGFRRGQISPDWGLLFWGTFCNSKKSQNNNKSSGTRVGGGVRLAVGGRGGY